MGRTRITSAERESRFWAKVVKAEDPKGCWLWAGSHNYDGYAYFFYDGQMKGAHRYSFQLAKGPIPAGKILDHLCRNRGCLNPDHMEVVDHQTNILRGVGTAAKHAAQTHCMRGHPFDEKNTYTMPSGRRNCRACRRTKGRQRYAASGRSPRLRKE